MAIDQPRHGACTASVIVRIGSSLLDTMRTRLRGARRNMQRSFARLSADYRLVAAVDKVAHPSGERQWSHALAIAQARRNTLDQIAALHTASGTLQCHSFALAQLADLAAAASRSLLGAHSLQRLQWEAEELVSQMQVASSVDRWIPDGCHWASDTGGPRDADRSGDLGPGAGVDACVQKGPSSELGRGWCNRAMVPTPIEMGLSRLDLTTPDRAQRALETVRAAQQTVGRCAASVAAVKTRLEAVEAMQRSTEREAIESRSRELDAGTAEMAAGRTRLQILGNSGVVLAATARSLLVSTLSRLLRLE